MVKNRKLLLEILAALLVVILITGCLGAEKAPQPAPDMGTGLRGLRSEAERAPSMAAPMAEKDSAESSLPTERKIIKKANLEIEVEDFNRAAEKVEAVAKGVGGFVSDSNVYVTDSGHRRGTLTLRVPEAKFQEAVKGLEGVGEVKSRSTSGQDVTEEYIDLEARLKNYQRQEERYLDLLKMANTTTDVLKVEEQLERVRGEIERLTGRLRYLSSRVELATITAGLYEPEPITRAWGLREAFGEAVEGFIGTINGLIVLTGTLLPLAIVLILLFVAYRRIRYGGG
ncbi:MAG: DUF4349 domain-containing protein [Candidatus Hydrothermarchaeota archaeon]